MERLLGFGSPRPKMMFKPEPKRGKRIKSDNPVPTRRSARLCLSPQLGKSENKTKTEEVTVKRIAKVVKKSHKFKCDDCDNGFEFKNSLKKHKQTKHSQEVHGCDVCDLTFVYKDSVTRHKKQMHSDTHLKFSCDFCSVTFKYKFNMYSHVKKYH